MIADTSTLGRAYVDAVNAHDSAGFVDLFAPDAVVDDNGRTFQGRDVIESWGRQDIFEPQVSLEIHEEIERDGATEISARVDGNFDRTGLPDPLVIVHRFESAGGRITRLQCRLA